MAADQSQVASVAAQLHALGARRGAFLLLINAAAQSQAAQVRDLTQWTPSGALPLAEKHLHAANDHQPATPAEHA